MRRVLYISGTRADYGPARAILKAIDVSSELELNVLVTGMHLDPDHGETWKEIENDKLNIVERVYGHVTGDSLVSMAASVGLYLFGISQAMERHKPDVVLVLGDRGEMLAGAMAAAILNITVVHLCGGSISGSIDDSIRHAITKFAHYHLVACDAFAKRVIQMGEDPESVHIVGLPGGDISSDVTLTKAEVYSRYKLPMHEPYLLVIQHSVTHSQEGVEFQIVETLEAVAKLGITTLLANPNDDAGGRVILRSMEEYSEKHFNLHILPPPNSRELFASVMSHATVLIGNSSCGTVEAMGVGLPVVNVGDRQSGRELSSCMLNVNYDRREIEQAILEAMRDSGYRKELNGFCSSLILNDTAQKVSQFLCEIDTNAGATPKEFCDIEANSHRNG